MGEREGRLTYGEERKEGGRDMLCENGREGRKAPWEEGREEQPGERPEGESEGVSYSKIMYSRKSQ